jgi:ATP-dependent Clp protease ATP-binding subunit ClpC
MEEPMEGFNLTERVRKVLAMAREEAVRLHHEYVGTEHILLGLARDDKGVAAAVLRGLGADSEALARRVKEIVRPGSGTAVPTPDLLPYTSRTKTAFEYAMAEARQLNHAYLGTEHLLLGLLREGKNIGAQVLNDAGVSLDAARSEVLRLLGTAMPAPQSLPPVEDAQLGRITGRAIDDVEVILHFRDGGRFKTSFGTAPEAVDFLQRVDPGSRP